MSRLAYPDGYNGSHAPHCGVLSVALCAGVSFETAWETVKAAGGYGEGWEGRTYAKDRRSALQTLNVAFVELLAVPAARYAWLKDRREDLFPCCTVATFAKKHARAGVTYMLNIKGHVVTLKDGLVADQGGIAPAAYHPSGKKRLQIVVEIIA
ncbi:hypothetical protein EOE18_15380 [Novosphingobium umbonatum]|uniref:Uncharacterized protein n=1 Tax=Novosphingobium umbonatum TaxID=1908524 RepID=A0A3S2V4U4_9SPHN|nr:hypothetical protein [Novosphingobium umbonatum]RVU03502.1 hypothetical protein EOE18_15380 [Novosphingobium umbonatum]